MADKKYLGDSVYADCDGFGITLTTENGFGPSNTIYMEPQVLSALNEYIDYLKAALQLTGETDGKGQAD